MGSGPRNYTEQTIKKLFGLSGNQCSFPGCNNTLVNENNAKDSNICHIEGAKPGGERYREEMSDQERAHYDNLILLCVQHHDETNDVDKYTVDVLQGMKKNHVNSQLQEKANIFSDKRHLTTLPSIELKNIIGREPDLNSLYQSLFINENLVLVNGLGGLGKTALVRAYLKKYRNNYQKIAWVSQGDGSFLDALVSNTELCKNLEVPPNNPDAKSSAKEVMRCLARVEGGPNLLILDNIEPDIVDWLDYLPKPPSWHVLATSREDIEGFTVKSLDFLSEEQCIDLFLHYYQRGDLTREAVMPIVVLVDCHTLTIEILAKIARQQRLSIGNIISALEENRRANVSVPHNNNQKITRIKSYLKSLGFG